MARSIKYEYLLFAFFVGFLLHCALKSRNNLEGMGVCLPNEVGATCTGDDDGTGTAATCTGTADGAGADCALNDESTGCAVEGDGCEFTPATDGAACALNADSSACAVNGRNCTYTSAEANLQACGYSEYSDAAAADCDAFLCTFQNCTQSKPPGCAETKDSGGCITHFELTPDALDDLGLPTGKQCGDPSDNLCEAGTGDLEEYPPNGKNFLKPTFGQSECKTTYHGWWLNNNIPIPCKTQPGCADNKNPDDGAFAENSCSSADSDAPEGHYACKTAETGSAVVNGGVSSEQCRTDPGCSDNDRSKSCLIPSGDSANAGHPTYYCNTATDGYYVVRPDRDGSGPVRQCTAIDNAKNGYKKKCNDETDSKFDEDKMKKSDGTTDAQRSSDSDPSDFCASGYELKIAGGTDNSGDSDICAEIGGFPWWGWLLIIIGVLVVVAIFYKMGFFSKLFSKIEKPSSKSSSGS